MMEIIEQLKRKCFNLSIMFWIQEIWDGKLNIFKEVTNHGSLFVSVILIMLEIQPVEEMFLALYFMFVEYQSVGGPRLSTV